MIACAEWLGRDHTTCTRKPDGCVCEPKEQVCTCSDGPYHYSSCPMYKEDHDPFAALGKVMTKHTPTPNPSCGIKGGCNTWCGDIACKRHNCDVRIELRRMAAAAHMSESEFIRNCLYVRVYGLEHVVSMQTERLLRATGNVEQSPGKVSA